MTYVPIIGIGPAGAAARPGNRIWVTSSSVIVLLLVMAVCGAGSGVAEVSICRGPCRPLEKTGSRADDMHFRARITPGSVTSETAM